MEIFGLFVMNLLSRVKNNKGQTLVEYALIIVLIALAAIAAMKFLGGSVNNAYSSASNSLTSP